MGGAKIQRQIERLACTKPFFLVDQLEKMDSGHSSRIQENMQSFFNYFPEFQEEVNVANLYLLCTFHDVGKLVLNNGSDRSHCSLGFKLARLNFDLRPIARAILLHHEWWDGTLSNFGGVRDDIPISSRIINIFDFYDRMMLKVGIEGGCIDQEIVLGKMEDLAGTQFDPHLTSKAVIVLRGERKHFFPCQAQIRA